MFMCVRVSGRETDRQTDRGGNRERETVRRKQREENVSTRLSTHSQLFFFFFFFFCHHSSPFPALEICHCCLPDPSVVASTNLFLDSRPPHYYAFALPVSSHSPNPPHAIRDIVKHYFPIRAHRPLTLPLFPSFVYLSMLLERR